MDVAKPPASNALARLASGIEAGVIGGLAMLGLLVSGSLLRGHVWWETFNLLGSTFYGSRAFRLGPSMATISGAALHFTITGAVGALFGLICGGLRERRQLVPLGMMAGILWYYLGNAIFWQRINPLIPRYAFQPVALLSHAVFGACLGFMNRTGPAPQISQSAGLDVSVSSDRSHADD